MQLIYAIIIKKSIDFSKFIFLLVLASFVYLFHLYEDLDGSIKAVTTAPTKYAKNIKTTETLATGARVTFQ